MYIWAGKHCNIALSLQWLPLFLPITELCTMYTKCSDYNVAPEIAILAKLYNRVRAIIVDKQGNLSLSEKFTLPEMYGMKPFRN